MRRRKARSLPVMSLRSTWLPFRSRGRAFHSFITSMSFCPRRQRAGIKFCCPELEGKAVARRCVTSNLVELFVLKNAAISTELRDVLARLNISTKKSEVEVATDRLVDDYIRQIDYKIRSNAERMAEFYK